VGRDDFVRRDAGKRERRAEVRTFESDWVRQDASAACHPEQGHVQRRVTGTNAGLTWILCIGLTAVVHRAGFVIAARAGAEFLDRPCTGARQHDRRSKSGHLADKPDGQQPRHVTADELHSSFGV